MAKDPYDVPPDPWEDEDDHREKMEDGENADAIRKINAHVVNLHCRLNHSEVSVLELKAKLKETIRAVEKLAKGKSLGALGLPTEESWAPPPK